MFYTVSEMAELLGLPPSTLRYYDREGLLPFVERSEGGVRIFKKEDYRWLKMITCLKSAGMTLKDIRKYIDMAMQGDSTVEGRLQMFENQREKLIKQMEELKQTLDIVEYKCWYYELAVKTGTEDVPKNMTNEELPSEFIEVRRLLRKY